MKRASVNDKKIWLDLEFAVWVDVRDVTTLPVRCRIDQLLSHDVDTVRLMTQHEIEDYEAGG